MTEKEKDFVFKLFLYIMVYSSNDLRNRLQNYCYSYLLGELRNEDYDGYERVAYEVVKNGFAKEDIKKFKKIIKGFGDLSFPTSTEVSNYISSYFYSSIEGYGQINLSTLTEEISDYIGSYSYLSIKGHGQANLSTLTEVNDELSDRSYLSVIESKPLKNKNKKTNSKRENENPQETEDDTDDYLYRLYLYIVLTDRSKKLGYFQQRIIDQLREDGYNRYAEVYIEVQKYGFTEKEVKSYKKVIKNVQNINENIAISFNDTATELDTTFSTISPISRK